MIPILQVGTPKSRKGEWLALGPAAGAQSRDTPPGPSDGRAHALHGLSSWVAATFLGALGVWGWVQRGEGAGWLFWLESGK